MTNYRDRMNEIVLLTAQAAMERPLLDSGLWTHTDIRNNFYEASYLYTASHELDFAVAYDRDEGIEKSIKVLLRVLDLQDRNQDSATFGHWPLSLQPSPIQAEKNPLPAELMGILMVYFYQRYALGMDEQLKREFVLTIESLYCSTYYRQPQRTFGHHEAKYTASKLVFGYHFEDKKLLEAGRQDLELTLERIRRLGMAEYGALPWFWHWIEAFTCAYECVPDANIRNQLSGILDELWLYRAQHYLKGTWIGGRMRSLAMDLPKDTNVAFDYVQFGDFPLPKLLPRVEYAGLLFYKASDHARDTALNIEAPVEMKRTIVPGAGEGEIPLHSYLYRTEHFSCGGIWERAKEFDNEQHRWEIALPLNGASGVNRLYIFSPGEGYTDGDPRHASDIGDVIFHKNTIMALYPDDGKEDNRLVGVLPKGEWNFQPDGLYGCVQGVYLAVFVPVPYTVIEGTDRFSFESLGFPNGIVAEAISVEDSADFAIGDLKAFASYMEQRKPTWRGFLKDSEAGELHVTYKTMHGADLHIKQNN